MKLLFEIGVEELPARYVKQASLSLLENLKKKLKEKRISFTNSKDFNSPRRIAVIIDEISEMQEDLYEKKNGPSLNIAFNENKELTQAALGFLKSQNMSKEDIKIEKNEKSEYIYVEKTIKGQKTKDLISNILIETINSLEFDKTMKWSDKSFRFARPIKWILATLNNEVIDIEFEGLKASNITRGMRLFGNQEIEVKNSSDYENLLLENYVIADYEKRKTAILKTIKENCESENEKVIINQKLLDEVINLVEYPYAIKGEFNKDFLTLPEQIITITMEVHQRYFPIVDKDNKLTNKFVIIRNAPEYSEMVKNGNEKVIIPRLSDAKFFYEEDLKVNLEDNVNKLSTVLFQKDMGSILEKVNRSKKIAKYILENMNRLDLLEDTLRAIHLSKADLVSNVINEKEFTKLQGFMGSIYAQKSNEKEVVSKAIFEHYLPRYQGDILPSSLEGSIAAISDKLDTLVGCYCVNLIPTSSKDPYALRRAAQGIVQIMLNSKIDVDYSNLINEAFNIFETDKKVLNINAKENILEFFKQRVENILSEKYTKSNISSLIDLDMNLVSLEDKLDKLESLSKTENFNILVNLIKRLKNISKHVDHQLDPSLFTQDEEKQLYNLYLKLDTNFENIEMLLKEKDIINDFFDNVKINVDDEKLKNNRLSLINICLEKIEKLIKI